MNKINMSQAETIVGGNNCGEVCEVTNQMVMNGSERKCFHVSVCKDKNGAVVRETWVPTNLNSCGISG